MHLLLMKMNKKQKDFLEVFLVGKKKLLLK
jgi:hypothetical protein